MTNNLDCHHALSRLMSVLHTEELLTEGQLASITGLDRVQVRELVDDGRSSLLIEPPKAAFLKAVMRRINATRTYDELPTDPHHGGKVPREDL